MSVNYAPIVHTIYDLIQSDQLSRAKKQKLTPNFTFGEFVVHRSYWAIKKYLTKDHIHNMFLMTQQLQTLRTDVFNNASITITSGWRDELSNRQVGGARQSYHLTGQAADIIVAGLSPVEVQNRLRIMWRGGLGYGGTFTHLDNRGKPARFYY